MAENSLRVLTSLIVFGVDKSCDALQVAYICEVWLHLFETMQAKPQ